MTLSLLTRIISAGILLLALTISADAFPLIGLALGAIGIVGVAADVLTFAIGIGAAVGLSYLAKALAPKPPDITSIPGGTTGKVQSGGAVPRSFVVGRAMTAGSLVYGNTFSPDAAKTAATALSKTTAAAGNTPNAYVVQVIALSDIPVTGLVGLLVGGVPVTWDPFLTPSFEGIAIPEYNANNSVESYGDSIPSTGPYTVSISGAPNISYFTSTQSVLDTTTNVTMTQVAHGQELPDTYSFNAGTKTYTFNASNSSHSIIVYFNYRNGGVTGTDYLWVRFYDGTQVAADAGLVALYGSDPNRPYTSARVGTGVAYAVVTALTNQNLFSGFPQVKFILDGVKLYDRRYDTSVGGSGSQRWATPSTWVPTGNPVVIAENILRGISYGGHWVYGAQTVTATQLPSASWTAAASECDSPIDLVAGGTEPQFYAGGEITFDTEPASTLDELLKSCNGRLAEIGGAYKIRAGAAGSAVFSFSDADILSTEQQTFDPFPSLGQTINAVTATYVSPAEAWTQKAAAPLYDSGLEALDGGARLPVNVVYGFVTSGTAVQRLMKSERDNQRAFRRHALPMPPDAFVLEPLDVISWTSARNGYSSKLFEIVTADDLPNLNMGLALKEIDPNAYDWVAATDEVAVVDGTIAMLRPPPQPIVDWSAIPYTLIAGGSSRAAIELSWDPNTDDVDGIGFEIRLAATAATVYASSFHDSMMFVAGSIIVSQNLIPNTAYQARGRYLPISVRDTEWSAWLDVTTPNIPAIGLIDIPAEVTKQFQLVNDHIQNVKDVLATVARQDAQNFVDQLKTKGVIKSRVADLTATIGDNFDTLTTAISTATATALSNTNSAIASYDITVAATYGTISSVSQARIDAISSSEAYADHAVSVYDVAVQAAYATKTAVATAKSEAISTALSDANSAVAAYNITVAATYGTISSVATAKAGAITTAGVNANNAISAYDLELATDFRTGSNVSQAAAYIRSTSLSNANSAISTYDQHIVATYGTIGALNLKASTASVDIVSTAVSTVGGKLAATYQITLAAGGIASLTGYAGNDAAGWVFNGNYFKFAFPGVSGGSPVDVLAISNVGITPKIVFRADMIGDGTLSMNKIVADSVVTNVLRSPSGLMVINMGAGTITVDDGL